MKIIWKFGILTSLNPDLLLFWHFCRKMKVDNTVSKQLTKLGKEPFHSLFCKVLKICKSSRWCFSTIYTTFNCLCAVWAQRILSILSLSLTFSLFALRLGCPGHWAAEGTVIPSTLSLSETLTQPGIWSAQLSGLAQGSVGASFQSAQQKTKCSFSSLCSLQDWWVHSAPDSAHSELIGYTYVKSPDFYQHFPKFLFSNCYKKCSLGKWGKVCKTGHQTHVFHNVTNWVISDSWFKIFIHQIISEWNRLSAVTMSMIGERTFRILGHSFSKAKVRFCENILMRSICWNSWLTVLCLLFNTVFTMTMLQNLFLCIHNPKLID